MNRRDFIYQSSGLLVSAYFMGACSASKPRDKMDRIGMGTVLFRNRFEQTKPEQISSLNNPLSLLEVPQYYRDRFGISNVEFWSYHFESLERSYLEQLKGSLEKAGSKLINVQVDTEYNLAAANETERLKSIEHVKGWIDAASFLGSSAIRINPGNGAVESSIASLKDVSRYVQSKNMALLTENHFGLEMDPKVHLQIIEAVGHKNIYTLPDFGNYDDAIRYEALEKIMPYAYLVSAKAAHFNENIEHLSYDFDRCVRMAEDAGFKGIYSVEQWSPEFQQIDYEKVGDWLIEHVMQNIG